MTTETQPNIQLRAAYLFWVESCWHHFVDNSTEALLEDFNKCMDQTKLSVCLGKASFELLLQWSRFESDENNGITYWEGVAKHSPLDLDTIDCPDFPGILK
jgi:hypothetical protein